MGAIMTSLTNKDLSQFYPARRWKYLSWYDQQVLTHVYGFGGFHNAHAHLDRAWTLEDDYLSHIGTTPIEASSLPLSVKQNLVGNLHEGCAYTETNLRERMRRVIETQIAYGVTRIDTCIDAAPKLPEEGLLAIRVARELKREFAGRIGIRIAPNPIFGFKEGTGRWEVFEGAARDCDYLSLLPEKDDFDTLEDKDGKVGFRNHIRMGLKLACELGKPVQLHLDQANIPGERGTEMLLEGLEWLDQPVIGGDEPAIWVIHMISPSAYSEDRFARLMDGLLKHNIGVIVCPTAAISMRQIRSVSSPAHNSIARIVELIKKSIPVRIGTDNICDVFVPQSDGDMLTEIKVGGHAVRVATPSVWAKLATGTPLNAVDITTVGRILYEDRKACTNLDSEWLPAIE